MKTHLNFIFLLLFVYQLMPAQALNEKNLQGSWSVKAVDIGIAYVDYTKDSVHLADKLTAGRTTDEIAVIKKSFLDSFDNIKNFKIDFYEGSSMKITISNDRVMENRPYTVVKKDNKYFIKDTESKDELPASMAKGLLYVEFPKDATSTFTAIFHKE